MKNNDPKIIKKTTTYLVIEKPSGLLVHPTSPKAKEESLLTWLGKKFPETKKIGDPERPGLVHRLDKDVSGLMVIPRTEEMYEHLKTQFQEHTVEKHYTALVHGKVGKDTGEITFKIARSNSRARMAARPDDEEGREAHTEFETLKRLVGSSLLDVRIHTGRTHQIRAHMFGYGHPVVGDTLYRHKNTKLKRTPDRIFLHSTKLAFTDLKGKRVEFDSPLPESLENFLTTLTGQDLNKSHVK
jgi:23S rRNA pseudouridine1911/1915/1917 synthase